MNILAIDTSSVYASCAVLIDGEIKSEVVQNSGLVHSKSMLPIIESALSQAQLKVSDIDKFAVCAGPGSFTGVRIGVCAVKGLAVANNKPCICVNTLDCLAQNILSEKLICPIMDARRGQVYCAAYVNGEKVFSDSACDINDLLSFIGDREAIFVGDGIDVNRDVIFSVMGVKAHFAPANLCFTRAASAAVLAQNLPEISADELSPIYLRVSQAEREYANRHS